MMGDVKANKHYYNMTRIEKRAYKRYLAKNNMWDGAVVIERLIQKDKLVIKD